MVSDEVIARICKTKIIAILRGDLEGKTCEIAGALAEGGITAIEVSLVSPGYATAIRLLVKRFSEWMAIGAGTVMTEHQVKEVAACGASFVVSPNCDSQVIAATRALGMASVPGAYTATEVVHAMRCGADAVKLFPAGAAGPDYVRALCVPIPEVRLVPTGGITERNIAAYLAAGAWAVGVGSELVNARDAHHFDYAALKEKACRFVAATGENGRA